MPSNVALSPWSQQQAPRGQLYLRLGVRLAFSSQQMRIMADVLLDLPVCWHPSWQQLMAAAESADLRDVILPIHLKMAHTGNPGPTSLATTYDKRSSREQRRDRGAFTKLQARIDGCKAGVEPPAAMLVGSFWSWDAGGALVTPSCFA
eukprot:3253500-Pleurochrysis_carterae.AAC.1